MTEWKRGEPWYHGSPLKLEVLRAGSTITQDRELACVFSHKPTLVCIEDDGRVRHNGVRPGYLHVVADVVGEGDVSPHPRTSMAPGLEWLTSRDLRLELIGSVAVDESECLSESEIAALLQGKRPD